MHGRFGYAQCTNSVNLKPWPMQPMHGLNKTGVTESAIVAPAHGNINWLVLASQGEEKCLCRHAFILVGWPKLNRSP